MEFENINCPQFVDFTSIDTFNINDGADFCFDRGIVGEQFPSSEFKSIKSNELRSNSNQNDQKIFQDISNKSNNLNITKEVTLSIASPVQKIELNAKPPKCVNLIKPKIQPAQENQDVPKKASEFLAKFNKENKKSVNNGSVNNQTIVKVTNEPKIQKDLNIIRRERSCENRTSRLRASSISRNLNNKSSNVDQTEKKPPIIIKKQPTAERSSSRGRCINLNEKINTEDLPKTNRRSRKTTEDTLKQIKPNLISVEKSPVPNGQRKSSAESVRGPALYQGMKFIPKLQTNFKTTPSEKIIESIKSRPTSLNREKQSSLVKQAIIKSTTKSSCNYSPKISIYNSTLIKHGSNENISSSFCKLNLSGLNSSSIVKTNSKPAGLLHTELRALKRLEYESQIKERERTASQVRLDLEREKIKKQLEEIKKLRSQSIVRSNPIKQYKPVEVKPSAKPLTNPISPNLGISFHLNSPSLHKSKLN